MTKTFFWNCLLCRCSVLRNENKFYRIQLRCKDQERFSVFVRRGRISEQGSSKTITCSSLEQAKCTFLKLFFEKTGRCWETHYFNDATNVIPALPFKYAIVHLHRQLPQPKTRSSKSQGYSAGNLVADSTLSKPVQDVISIICPIKLVDDSGIVQERDTSSNAPIGELSEEQIRLGYESLERIKSCLELNKSRQELCRACDQYYTLIPHAFSRSSHIPMVDSTARLISEFCYLTSLERTTTLVPIDVAYNYLQCKIVALNKDSVEYQTLSRSFHTTHAKIDNQFDVSVEQIFELSKPREQLTFKNCGNRRLLWHGSPLNNHAGILERGLRVAPIEAVCSGYMFGKGVYFTDVSCKSIRYCRTSRQRPDGLMLLAEVSLGRTHVLHSCQYDLPEALPDSKHSVHGIGCFRPSSIIQFKGLPLAMGPLVDNPKCGKSGSLFFDEFVVYSPDQIRLRYLIKLTAVPNYLS